MHKNIKGLTLIELIVALAVITILIAIAGPNFTSLNTSNKLTAKLNSLAGDFALTRNEAVTRNSNITIAANIAATGWSSGWKVFIDADADGIFDAGETQIKVSDALGTGTIVITDSGTTSATYTRDGSQNAGSFWIKFCDSADSGNDKGKEIDVIASGRHSLIKGQGSGINCP